MHDRNCVTDAANLRPAPRFDGDWGSDFRPDFAVHFTDLPEKIAATYELYAYAIRAKGCEEGRWPEPKTSDRLATYCWTKLKNGCKECTEIAQNAANSAGAVLLGVANAGLEMCANPSDLVD